MLFFFLSVALSLVVTCFVFSRTLFPLLQTGRMKKRLLREGEEADAVLLNIEQTGLFINNRPQIKLQVQVHPPSGRNFVSEVREVLSLIDLSQLRIGSNLKVKYNPANTKEVIVLRREALSF